LALDLQLIPGGYHSPLHAPRLSDRAIIHYRTIKDLPAL
jgi:hypothetical protein